MTAAELDSCALKLRGEGLTYREVGARMGETDHKARQRCKRARNNRWKDENRDRVRAYGRAYLDENRYACPECGYVYGKGSGTKNGSKRGRRTDSCPGCIESRRQRIVQRWKEGRSLAEIADHLGWTENHLGNEIHRMRQLRYDLPYRHKSVRQTASAAR